MAEDGTSAGISKSAKRRAAKKARESAGGDEAAGPTEQAPPVATKESNKENSSNVKPKAEAKAPPPASAEPKPKAKAAPAKPDAKAEPKAEPKAVAKAKPEPKPAAKPAAKSSAKAKPAKPAPVEEEEPPKKEPDPVPVYQIDDGTGGEWEAVTGMTKKQQKKKERVEQETAARAAATSFQNVPANQPRIPGMVEPAPAKAGAKAAAVTAPVVASAVVSAAAAGSKAEDAKKQAQPEVIATTTSIAVPPEKIGIVIGPKGKNITSITQKTGVTRIETSGETFSITGPAAAVAQARDAIQELIDKGYTSLNYDDFSENQIPVHPSCFPDLIGKKGAVIMEIKKELGVEITIPKLPPNPPASKKFKVTIAGKPDQVEKAKKVIEDIVMYGYSTVTHPGFTHKQLEMAANDGNLRFIIGTKGSELKHIQNNYHVRVQIPREHSANQYVCIIGEEVDVERANDYIEKILWNAAQPKGRDRTDDGDIWGEEETEDWMKQYLYKR